MKRYLLDSSALLALRDNEPGATQVADLLYQAQRNEAICMACFMSLMEILYIVWREEDEETGRLAYEQCLSLPLQWLHEDKQLLEKAAELKATSSISLANAWIAAGAILHSAILVHKDPEFETISCPQLRLPYSKT